MVKNFLALEVKKLHSFIAPIFGIYVKFLDFLFLDKFTTVLLALLPPLSTILLLLALNTFGANLSNDLVIFNKKISGAATLLKPWMKH